MTATALFTYLWHYMVARLLYDEVLRPLLNGRPLPFLALGALTILVVSAVRRRLR